MTMFDCGFYGGKFLPFHEGHKYCIRFAAQQCRRLVVILFYNGEEEKNILNSELKIDRDLLNVGSRIERIRLECAKYDNVEFRTLNCEIMHREALQNGTSTWDAETEYVLNAVGDFQAVYSSEPSYDDYFKRAYPFATHILIDVPRIHVPISGTKLRNMDTADAELWLK